MFRHSLEFVGILANPPTPHNSLHFGGSLSWGWRAQNALRGEDRGTGAAHTARVATTETWGLGTRGHWKCGLQLTSGAPKGEGRGALQTQRRTHAAAGDCRVRREEAGTGNRRQQSRGSH